MGGLGAVVPALCAVLMFGLSFASWLAKRAGAEGKATREMRHLNVVCLRYLYQVDLWAARRGLELPERPRELTMEGVTERAEQQGADLSEVVSLFEKLGVPKR
jgi:hypothetical protein